MGPASDAPTGSGPAPATVVVEVQGRADLAVVDLLAHLRLTAARLGVRLQVRDRCEDLAGMLELTGLAAAVCVLEPIGQAEAGEQGGAEEVVQVHDLPG